MFKYNKNNKYGIRQFLISTACLFALFFVLYFVNNPEYGSFLVQKNTYRPLLKKEKLYNFEEKTISPKELFNESWSLVKANYWDDNLNEQNWRRWKRRYENKIETEEDAYVAINSMLASLNDPYSRFLNREEYQEQNTSIDSKIYGIGVNIASYSGKIHIINVIKGAPAEAGGLKTGDIILKINGNEVKGDNVFQTAGYIKGAKNSLVELEILRNSERLVKKIKRAEIKIKTVEADVLDKEIGYIRIVSFISSSAPFEFIDALNQVKDTNGLILDLRGNTGGLFQNAVFVSNMFLPEGDIVKVIGRGRGESSYTAEEQEYVYDKPLVVLVDGESASASEIVSAALKDNNRAVIVGTKTFGKGVVQKIYDMPNKTGMNLTIARYLTPKGDDINKKGIEPNYPVEITRDDVEKNNDSQLNFAKNMLKNEIQRMKVAKAGR